MKNKLFMPDDVKDDKIEQIIEGKSKIIVPSKCQEPLFNYFSPTLHDIRNSNLPDNLLHELMLNVRKSGVAYTVSYRFNRDTNSIVELYQHSKDYDNFNLVADEVNEVHGINRRGSWSRHVILDNDNTCIYGCEALPLSFSRDDFLEAYENLYAEGFDSEPVFHIISYKGLTDLEVGYSNLERLVMTGNSLKQ